MRAYGPQKLTANLTRKEGMQGLDFVLGGARSGKSRMGEALVTSLPSPWTYIATAEAFDDEMRARIALHQAERQPGWRTVEAPLALAEAISHQNTTGQPILVDCLTLWLTNVLLADRDLEQASAGLLGALAAVSVPIVLVSNEVGLGIVPDNALARRFRDAQGRLNQQIAALAARVILMAAGLPLILKGPPL